MSQEVLDRFRFSIYVVELDNSVSLAHEFALMLPAVVCSSTATELEFRLKPVVDPLATDLLVSVVGGRTATALRLVSLSRVDLYSLLHVIKSLS